MFQPLPNLADIHPKRDAKYSPNLYAFLAAPHRQPLLSRIGVYRAADGTLWIGYQDAADGRYFIGARLISVLCDGASTFHAAHTGLGPLERLDDFWPRYAAVGRCAVDPAHEQHFIGDDSRWNVTGEYRSCRWCGQGAQRLRHWVEQVPRSAWIAEGAGAP